MSEVPLYCTRREHGDVITRESSDKPKKRERERESRERRAWELNCTRHEPRTPMPTNAVTNLPASPSQTSPASHPHTPSNPLPAPHSRQSRWPARTNLHSARPCCSPLGCRKSQPASRVPAHTLADPAG
ncbi:hypothetical protein T484DRAFT_2604700 [Baffinella frigidus]|nr:hypothetical protein T484DRAFT_2604700 [Cryptophyta sp. CCMP2293]